MQKPCPNLKPVYETKVKHLPEYVKIEQENNAFIDFLRQKSGRDRLDLIDMWDLYDPINCEVIFYHFS